ncbi:MAG: hypothetical protein U9N42_06230 [Campylobacterota bacterium]|nr:hypothetical protein [Campylobacterota bacterium]
MKILMLIALHVVAVFAQEIKVSDKLENIEVQDQFEKKAKMLPHKTIVYSWDKEQTQLANDLFDKEPKLLNEAILVVDSSQIPWGIKSLFVLPKMKNYSHSIYLNDDEQYNKKIAYKDGYLTVLKMDGDVVKSIVFVKDMQGLKEEL